jgi:hypothetical protein
MNEANSKTKYNLKAKEEIPAAITDPRDVKHVI